MSQQVPILIFTDLDGTLLDHYSYRFDPARPVIEFLNHSNIPWILNTSKTLAELDQLRIELDNKHPLVVENGGGIAIPANHPLAKKASTNISGDWCQVTLGTRRINILEALKPLRRTFQFRGFNDMSSHELSELTGLSPDQAKQAMNRQFSEPLIWLDSSANLERFSAQLARQSLHLLRGGRFIHVTGASDKGKAAAWLSERWPDINDNPSQPLTTIALGDGENDIAMLEQADVAIVIRSPVHEPLQLASKHKVIVSRKAGPEGWAETLIGVLSKLGYAVR